MADDHVWTAEELERLTPDERHRVVDEGIVTDFDQLPPDFVERVRSRGRRLVEERGLIAPAEDGD
ncbi:MAG: hypothetical protein U5K30_14125 [Acidimicrobiales bacterium]|nr:hypothetical protein [Acidimicrobiales bacterium]